MSPERPAIGDAMGQEGTQPRSGGCVIVVLERDGVYLRGPEPGARERLGLAELHWLAVAIGAEAPIDSLPAPNPSVLLRLEREVAAGARPPTPTRDPIAAEGMRVRGPERAGDHVLVAPVAAMLTAQGYELVDHQGTVRVRLDALHLAAASGLAQPQEIPAAFASHKSSAGPHALDEEQFIALVATLRDEGLVVPLEDDPSHLAEGRAMREFRRGFLLARDRVASVATALSELALEEERRVQATGRTRTKVVPVNSEGNPLQSLGMVMSHAIAHDGGRLAERYEFLPDWGDCTVPALTGEEPPALYLFSNYIWSHAWNVVRSAEVKAKSPGSLTIHGGPNTPKYEADTQAFFHNNPQVDITVHGEGESAFVDLLDALDGALGDGPPDLSILRDVPGISYRDGSEIVHTGNRDRIADLDTIPSPYLTGLFDSTGGVEIALMTFESNRGCPYGCTFCDWGSATNSRIRKFDLDRVFAELEWCAQHRVHTLFCADANFGIFARDVEIAEKVVELHQSYGFPKTFESSYAKNSVKHLRQIIETLASGGILATGTLSLQSVDPGTLDAIHRSNIKVEKYDDLATEFGRNGLPLVIELMMGLPGSTMESFLGDLQQCIDREVKARVNPTEVLMNSPMNAPDYREEHRIETIRPVTQDWSEANQTRKKALVISTATFGKTEYDRMERYRQAFLLAENYAVLRHLSRFVRQETGIKEMDLYVRLVDETAAAPQEWPLARFMLDMIVDFMAPPVSWRLFIDEIHRFLVTRIGIADSSALRTALDVQHALLPSRGRSFPCILELEHDFAAWHEAMLDHKRHAYLEDWIADVPRLGDFGPATFEVDDPQDVCSGALGMSLFYDADADWELGSPIARPMRFRHTVDV